MDTDPNELVRSLCSIAEFLEKEGDMTIRDFQAVKNNRESAALIEKLSTENNSARQLLKKFSKLMTSSELRNLGYRDDDTDWTKSYDILVEKSREFLKSTQGAK